MNLFKENTGTPDPKAIKVLLTKLDRLLSDTRLPSYVKVGLGQFIISLETWLCKLLGRD